MGKRKQTLNDFTSWTTSHGLPHIGRSTNKCMLLFWTIVCLVAFSLMIWQVIELILRYLRYDVAVGMQLKFEQRGFPAVTVCNMNPFDYEKVAAEQDTAYMIPVMRMLQTYEYALKRANCDANETMEYLDEWPDCVVNQTKKDWATDFGMDGIKDTVALQSKARDLLVLLMAGVSSSKRMQLSIQKQDFIRSCSFNTKDCNLEKDFMLEMDPKFGNCYTFNKQKVLDAQKKPYYAHIYDTNRAGPLYARECSIYTFSCLRLILLTNTSQYLSLTEKAGVLVVIHNQTEIPFPDTFGYSVEVGSATSVGVSFKEMHRMGKPYGTGCRTSADSNFVYEGSYTSEGCQRSCFQNKVVTACNCRDPNYPALDDYQRPCLGNNPADLDCWMNIIGNTTKDLVSDCDCPLACEEGVYDVTVSAAKWPSEATVKIADCNEGDYDESCLEVFRENGVLVEVFYEQLNYQLLRETPAYAFVNLASDFGGQLGLWMGMSIISMVEFMVLFGQLCNVCFKRPNKVHNRKFVGHK